MAADPRRPASRAGRLHQALNGITLDTTPFRQSRNFRLLLGGQTINLIGSQMTLVAVPYQVYLLTHSNLAVGALALVQLVPLVTMYILGGTLADMMDRRRLMLITQALLLGTTSLFAIAAYMGRPPLWYLFVVAACAAGVQAVDNPTRRASIPRMVARDQLVNAFSLNSVLSQAGQIIGPGVGGLILARFGFGPTYTINVATFFISWWAVWSLSPLPPVDGAALRNPLPAVAESFRYLKSKPILLSNFVVDVNGQVFGLPKALFPAFATDVFHTGAIGLGLLNAAPAAGALLAALLTGWCSAVRRQGRMVVVLVGVWGGAIAVFGLAAHFFWLGLLMLAIAGAADTYTAVIRNTILQLVIPDQQRGRLSSISMLFTTGGPRLGNAEAGIVAQFTNVELSAVSGGLLTILGCAVIAFAIPVYWNWDAQTAVEYTG